MSLPVEELTAVLVDTSSVSGREGPLADLIEEALDPLPHLAVQRSGDTVVARTTGSGRRVVLAGHIDTVPLADNLPSRVDGDRLYGCGTSDMKAGVAVQLALAVRLSAAAYQLTYVFYDNEEVEAERNGLGRISRAHPDWLVGDLAILLEPTSGQVEAGCQGTMRAVVSTTGRRAHSARSWLGDNAIHGAAPVLARLAAYTAREAEIDGCTYREGLNAVGISGGVAGNIVPDECAVTVNFRFAPDRSEDMAFDHIREVFDGFAVSRADSAPGALPGLSDPLAQEFVAAVGTPPAAKYGWTDVSRFASMGIPALNFGPGDPNLAHTREEYVELARIGAAEAALRAFLGAG
ncbi:MAG: succinyl-diaminopimelate desuccinylase [Pseudonocardiales bacterium]|nr:MAG: succinyl-diaminopimelate desuccinylase [Pseudonocardiales bacterium]